MLDHLLSVLSCFVTWNEKDARTEALLDFNSQIRWSPQQQIKFVEENGTPVCETHDDLAVIEEEEDQLQAGCPRSLMNDAQVETSRIATL